jgi:hypothetical protein
LYLVPDGPAAEPGYAVLHAGLVGRRTQLPAQGSRRNGHAGRRWTRSL